MDEQYISRGEFSATVEKLEAEDTRENKRLGELEETVKQINDLTRTVDKLATNMEHMLEEQKAQGRRLEALEERDGQKWRKAAEIVFSALVGGVIGFCLKAMGIF